jgi:CheY-like chemotaxis protein
MGTGRFAILAVDDDPDILGLIEKMFRDRPWDITTCSSGAEALRLTTTEWYDLVLLDLEMPQMNGLTVARQLRSRERSGGPRVIIVALTAQTSTAHRANALEAQFDGFLTKPFRRAELAAALEKYLTAGTRAI